MRYFHEKNFADVKTFYERVEEKKNADVKSFMKGAKRKRQIRALN